MELKQAETSKSIFRNVLYGFSTWILPLGLSFFAIPIIVRALGVEDYGIYVLVLGFIGYSFNFSFGRAITKYIAEYRAAGKNEKIRDVISAAFFLSILIGSINAAVICLSAKWLVSDVFLISSEAQTKTIYAFYIAAAIIFFSMLNQIFSSILQGIYRFDTYSKIFNLSSLTLLAGNIFLALYGYGLNTLLIWNLVTIWLTLILYFLSAKKLLNEFGINSRFKRETLKLVLSYSSGVIGYQILSNFLLLFERGWITRNLGAENLTYYNIPLMLALYIHGFTSSLLLVVFPLASELNEQPEKLLRLYKKAIKIICLLVVFMAATLIVQSEVFLTLWVGGEFPLKSTSILVIHTITFSLLAIQIVPWQLTEGLGFPKFNLKVFAVCFVVTISLMILLVNDYGNFGVAIARMIGFSSSFLATFYVEKWFFGRIQTELWLAVIGKLTAAALLAAFVQKIIIWNISISWINFLFSVFCGGIVYLLTVWLLGYITEDEKLLIKTILKR